MREMMDKAELIRWFGDALDCDQNIFILICPVHDEKTINVPDLALISSDQRFGALGRIKRVELGKTTLHRLTFNTRIKPSTSQTSNL